MGVAVLLVSNLSGASHGFGLLVRVLASVAVGAVAYLATAVIMAQRERRGSRRSPPQRPW